MAPPPPLPADHEAERLRVLHALRVLDTAPEPLFDSIARLASQVCGTPIALLSLVDGERQWFKANVGLDGVSQTPRAMAFCAHAIGGDALFEVGDATDDPRFASNPLVTGDPSIRFYAGAPLALPGGQRVGTLCVIDRVQRQLEPAQAALLQALAAIATQALQMRRDLIERLLASSSDYERALQDSRALLLRTGRVAGVGGWQLDLVRSRLNWSEQTRVIHEVGPDFEPTLDNAIAFYTPEARPLIEAAVQHAIVGHDHAYRRVELTEAAQHPVLALVLVVAFDPHRGEQLLGDADLPVAVLACKGLARAELARLRDARHHPFGVAGADPIQRFA